LSLDRSRNRLRSFILILEFLALLACLLASVSKSGEHKLRSLSHGDLDGLYLVRMLSAPFNVLLVSSTCGCSLCPLLPILRRYVMLCSGRRGEPQRICPRCPTIMPSKNRLAQEGAICQSFALAARLPYFPSKSIPVLCIVRFACCSMHAVFRIVCLDLSHLRAAFDKRLLDGLYIDTKELDVQLSAPMDLKSSLSSSIKNPSPVVDRHSLSGIIVPDPILLSLLPLVIKSSNWPSAVMSWTQRP
jgi:hypothetical protein